RNVTTFDIASLLQALPNGAEHSIIELSAGKQADQRHAWLLRARRERPRGCAAEQRDELAPIHQQFLPCFEAEDSTPGNLPHCGISKQPLSAMGHQRLTPSKPHYGSCPLCSESGQIAGRLATSALCHVWTAPSWQGLSSRPQAGRCSHVFGLLMRFT